jgi:hypothetical protein
MIAQAHRRLVLLMKAGVSPENISHITGIPVAAVMVIMRSPLATAEAARAA